VKIRLEIQHFSGCPNGPRMINNVKEALKGYEDKVELNEVLVEDIETVKKIEFLGSPTLLINGEDFEGRKAEGLISLNCRIYKNGVPTAEQIREKIKSLL